MADTPRKDRGSADTVDLLAAVDTEGKTLSVGGAGVDVAAELAADPTTFTGGFRTVDPDDYDREGEIAQGGMGRIVAAYDRRHGRRVALKEPLSADRDLVARFRREAMVTARLQHPAIVPIYEAGRWPDGRPFFAMRRVDGRALDQVIAERTSLADRLALLPTVIAVAEALAYAHMQGVVHRDLKPHNVLVGAYGETVVIDWGLAKQLGSAPDPRATSVGELPSTVTQLGRAVGTPAYMAPEQARGEDVDERTDVYALGALLYHLLAGRAPYADTAAQAHRLIDTVAAEAPTPLPALNAEIPAELIAIVDKAMARAPADRYPSARELAADLRRFSAGRLVGAHRYGLATLLARWARRHRLVLTAAAAVVVASAIAAIVYVRGLRIERARTAAQQRVAEHERARAEAAAARAEAQTRTLLLEQGQQRLAAGRPLEAAAYLARAYELGDDATVRTLLGLAMPTVDGLVLRHGDGGDATVAAVAIDARRGRIVTAGWDGTVRAWDADTGRELARVTYRDRMARVAVLPDGAIVSGDHAGVVRRWDAATGAEATWGAFDTVVAALVVSGDGRHVAARDFAGAYKVWDAATGALVLEDSAASGALAAVIVEDGVVVAPGVDGGTIRALPDGRVLGALAPPLGHVARAADGRLAGARGPRLIVAGATGRELASTELPAQIAHVAWADDEVLAVTVTGTIVRWAPAAAQPRWRTELGAIRLRALAVTSDGRHALLCVGDGTLRVLDAATGQLLSALAGHDGEIFGVATAPDAPWVVTYSGDGSARMWRLDRVAPLARAVPAPARAARFFADGQRVAWLDGAGAVHVATPRGDALGAPRAPGVPGATQLALLDGGRLAVGRPGELVVWDDAAAAPIARLSVDGELGALAALPGGALAFATTRLGVWDPARPDAPPLWIDTPERVTELAALPDGGLVVSTGVRLMVADPGSSSMRHGLVGHTEWVSAIAAAADGHTISGDGSGAVRVWTPDGALRTRLVGQAGVVTAVALTTGARHAFAGGVDGAIRLWEVESGRLLATLRGHAAPVSSLALSPDGTRLVSTDAAGGVRAWDLTPEARPAAELAARVAAGSPFRVDADGRLRALDGSPR